MLGWIKLELAQRRAPRTQTLLLLAKHDIIPLCSHWQAVGWARAALLCAVKTGLYPPLYTHTHTRTILYPPHGSEHHQDLLQPAKTAKDTIVALC